MSQPVDCAKRTRGTTCRVVRIQLGLSSGGKFPKWLWLLMVIPLLVLVAGGLAAVGVLTPAFYSASRAVNEPNKRVTPAIPPKKSNNNSFASVLLDFGSEGIGPGMFTDARSIAVDGAGRIYVGEYNGQIQRCGL